MIGEIQDQLKELIYKEAELPRDAIDISFSAPTSSWVSGLTRPTLNVFLHDLRENTALRSAQFDQTFMPGGVRKTLVPRRMELRYLITPFFKSQLEELGKAEWNVLWRTLAALLRQPVWEEKYVPEVVRELRVDILGEVRQAPEGFSLFSGLGLSPRPALHYHLTVPLDLEISRHAPLVFQRDLTLPHSGESEAAFVVSTWQLRDPRGRPVARAFVQTAEGVRGISDAEGKVHLRTPRESVTSLSILTLTGEEFEVSAEAEGGQVFVPIATEPLMLEEE